MTINKELFDNIIEYYYKRSDMFREDHHCAFMGSKGIFYFDKKDLKLPFDEWKYIVTRNEINVRTLGFRKK